MLAMLRSRKSVKAGQHPGHRVGFPRFKRRQHEQGFRADNGPDTVRVDDKAVVLPKIGRVDMVEPLRFAGSICEVTVPPVLAFSSDLRSTVNGEKRDTKTRRSSPAFGDLKASATLPPVILGQPPAGERGRPLIHHQAGHDVVIPQLRHLHAKPAFSLCAFHPIAVGT